jgi:hypothetical protein
MRLKTFTQLSILPVILVSSPVSAAEPSKTEICQQWANLHASYTEPKMAPTELSPPAYIQAQGQENGNCNYYLEGPRLSLYECTVAYSDVSSYLSMFNKMTPEEKADPKNALKEFVKAKITTPLCEKR